MEEEAAVWEALPEDDAKSVWDETERNFFSTQQQKHNGEQAEADKEYQIASTNARVELGILNGRRSQLSESQSRLARELAKVEGELAQISETYSDKADTLARIEQEYRNGTQKRLEARAKISKAMKKFFREKRGEDPDANDIDDLASNGIAVAPDDWMRSSISD